MITSSPYPNTNRLGATGAEAPLSALEAEVQRSTRSFAEKVMRPIGVALDRRDAGSIVEADSPYWQFVEGVQQLGLNSESLAALADEERARLLPIVYEELGWGDAGLAVAFGTSMLPTVAMHKYGRFDLLQNYANGVRGCWGITEPDRGTDALDPEGALFHPVGERRRPNCVATWQGERVVIRGQKSAWVSNAPAAEICLLYCALDEGGPIDPARGLAVIVPLAAPGVSRGKPLDKLGQRPLPQGELFFDNVEVPAANILAGPEGYVQAVEAALCEANQGMGAIFTGAARAAYEMAFAYAHARKQGGVPIVRHASVAQRLFHMFRKVEMSRALVRRVALYNGTTPAPSLPAAIAAKVGATQFAFEVASDALQLFGGNGLTHEYPIEKLFRDTRAALIEDGCNEMLSIKGGLQMIDAALF